MFGKIICLRNGENLRLREAEKKDGKLVVDYLNEVGGESDNLSFGKNEFYLNAEREAIYIESFRKDVNSLFILAEINGELVAEGSLHSEKKKRMSHTATIGITVRKKLWNKVIASIILRELIEFAKNTDVVSVISLEVRSDNVHAIHLYERAGFKKSGIYKDYMKIAESYYDVDLMELQLQKR